MTSYVHFNANILLLLVLFSAEAYFKATYKEDFRVIISDNGRIRWRFGGHIRTVCPLDITYYPFDEQVCDVTLENWQYTKSMVTPDVEYIKTPKLRFYM